GSGAEGSTHPVRNPSQSDEQLGQVSATTVADAHRALRIAHDFAPQWAAENPTNRANLLRRIADELQANKPALMTLCICEAGKTVRDAEAEVREAIDYCRYYAGLAESLADPLPLPGSVGELNELSWHGRGPFLCISPWNFPLAIFCGQAMAALVSGNPVLLKPAEQTSLIAGFVTRLCHQAGVPAAAMQLLPGAGPTLGAALLPRGHRAPL
ncbi:MAG TPA: bifunctional proline dehydrogenase/L-glutamate gamma-semialdehyde dehydrogenase, partial [Porticoccaceae bacterium]|nr:bifunctional proline dehydrogenase/L-glutamate gamma-semialdehyde dehydrogenase [Porticoccaceae bacterium]